MDNERLLEGALSKSSLPALINLTVKVLARSGYGDIEVLGRRLNWQKSKLGGCELLCRSFIGNIELRVIVKVIRDFARTRMLDEMAGAMDRLGADLGLLVTTGKLGVSVGSKAKLHIKSRIHVVDVKLLAEMLRYYRIGVRPDGSPDYAFFGSLEAKAKQFESLLLAHGRNSW
ncbi:MAG: hypothetical protein GC165_00170 [Armatimonadetes bacterium]|nr:hypothetical protein [Armatimonadota bacterium]